MAKIKLAEALLRRKELQMKVDQLKAINIKDLFEIKFQRKQVSEQIDDLQAQIPKLTINQVTAAYDYYSKRLRLLDAQIQNLNWTTEFDLTDASIMEDYVDTTATK